MIERHLAASVARTGLVLSTVAWALGCSEPEVPWRSPIDFDTARMSVVGDGDTSRLLVEVARTGEQRGFGLMVRPELDPGSGMLFVYDSVQPPDAGFWMWRTRMPLDIAYVDSAGRIVSIRQMAPCESPYSRDCPQYSPGTPYQSALEVNQGWFGEHGFGVGDRVVVDSMAPPPGDAAAGSAGSAESEELEESEDAEEAEEARGGNP